jgi:hypothetical protein
MAKSKKEKASDSNNEAIRFRCPKCNSEEWIPKEVVDFFDIMDAGDPTVPPRFDCQSCPGKMEPVDYTNHDGIRYKL